MIEKLGVQVYTAINYMQTERDIRESFHKFKALGYDQIQTCGCPIPYERYGELAREAGLEIIGTHDSFAPMVNDFEQAYKNHQALGTKHMGIGAAWGEGVEFWRDFIEKANEVGEKVAAHGGYFTYHNHCEEFERLSNGKSVMEMLVEGLDPKTTRFVLDTYWIQFAGGDVRRWIHDLAGRISVLHLKDMAIKGETPYYTEIGNGNLWWEEIIRESEAAGVEYYVVEQDECPGDPFESLRISSEYIHRHFMR